MRVRTTFRLKYNDVVVFAFFETDCQGLKPVCYWKTLNLYMAFDILNLSILKFYVHVQ